ncbi:hypothetical protein E2C01_017197 [Portunus trituberculatus]|uniref:Uncharacterized protein n=1 Tax=Portunus trituberculatus TaxID=210409 RepID=A0A5B7DS85_PORTR|nr:hypothetical protein [Portunus trituberculatus]
MSPHYSLPIPSALSLPSPASPLSTPKHSPRSSPKCVDGGRVWRRVRSQLSGSDPQHRSRPRYSHLHYAASVIWP